MSSKLIFHRLQLLAMLMAMAILSLLCQQYQGRFMFLMEGMDHLLDGIHL
jgi:hypothetical protein